MKNGIINIHGKEYQTVALRVQMFRDKYPNYSITTKVIFRDETEVAMSAEIGDESGRILATGHAEEKREGSQINRTSALENCETSAIGRALAALGIGGTEFASANEVQNAIHKQNIKPLAGAGEALNGQKRNRVADTGIALCELWRADQKEEAFKLYSEITDAEEKMYLWDLLKNTKHKGTLIRSQLKAYAAQLNKGAA